jgi:N-methylhydantoinase B/oxoprolinase/acetone carboxylase alpha subunit
MGHVQDNAAAKVADEIAVLGEGEHVFADALDDGTPIRVALRVRGRRLEIDRGQRRRSRELNARARSPSRP